MLRSPAGRGTVFFFGGEEGASTVFTVHVRLVVVPVV